MKKITIIFLISIIISLLSMTKVNAKTQSFYQGEYIPNIFIHKKKSNGVILYSQARFIRKSDTNEIVYCIEPATYYKDGYIYETTETPSYTQEQILNMTLISHFGYGYKNHTDAKWYAITQLLIWEEADPSMKYYITESKSSNGTKLYTTEMNEIREMVNNYKKETSLSNKTYTIVEGETFTQTDQNNVLSNYTTKDNINIKDNTITIDNLPLGTHTFTLEKEHNIYNKYPIFYTNSEAQDLMEIGDPKILKETFTVNVINTSLSITKLDYDTNDIFPQGDASLINSTFNIYNKENILIKTITLKNTTETILNMPLGKYYLKEIEAGVGYELNENIYQFEISEENPEITLNIPNKVIKGTLQIKKEYGTENNFQPEANISFNIYQNEKLIKTIITNEQGIAEITLPYENTK